MRLQLILPTPVSSTDIIKENEPVPDWLVAMAASAVFFQSKAGEIAEKLSEEGREIPSHLQWMEWSRSKHKRAQDPDQRAWILFLEDLAALDLCVAGGLDLDSPEFMDHIEEMG